VIKVPRLKLNRHGVYSVRVYWRDETGKLRESLHSLSTKNPVLARLLALQFNEAFERKRAMTEKPNLPNLDDILSKYELDLSRGVMKSDGAEDHARMMEAIATYKAIHGSLPPLQEAMNAGRSTVNYVASRPVAKSMPLSQATAAYLEEKKHDNVLQTLLAKKRTYDDFIALFGDLDINLVSKAELVQWKTVDLKRNITASRINQRLGQLNDLFNWCIAHGHYTAHPTSPVEGLYISKKSKLAAQTESYEPFSNDEIKAIFASTYPEEMGKPDHYWLPIVALYSGARREEIASLKASNVKTIDGVDCFLIESGKTADARRVVPVHPQLKALGFMDYALQVQRMGVENLFPHLVDGSNGRGKNAGRQFGLLLDKRGIKDDRKVFHSFRHTVITRLHTTGANVAHVMQITGHRGENTQGVHFQTYTHDVGLLALAETLGKLDYPLNYNGIQASDPTFKVFLSRWKMQEERKAKAAKLRKEKTPT
jgi:integrase